ncbi:MAG: arginine--tRNA ligase, partial [Planctomycetes bacterium]|nr:arginine--tRNA ligase [Planctomycetota bacterium]
VLTAVTASQTHSPAIVLPTSDAKFGDYQANGIMAAAKRAKTNPRELAGNVLAALDLTDLAEKVEIAGPGFINVTLSDRFLADHLSRAADDDRLDVAVAADPQNVVVDYSGPNLAKEMHVGHLRSTIIGDAIANVLEFLGNRVFRQNHVGDWGTQFGMLIAYMDRQVDCGQDATAELADLEVFYRQAKQLFDSDADFARSARENVVKLQGGDESCLRRWRQFLDQSMSHCEGIYHRLGVSLQRSDMRGESAYNDDLPAVVADLKAAGLLTESDGAQCVFLPEFTGHNDSPLPLIVQKTDGGYLYATTDLAAIRYRVRHLKADRIIYTTDAGQALHFKQVFAVARKAGFVGNATSLEHVPFGVMLDAEGRRFRTRQGGTVKLMELLDEAERRAADVVAEKNPDLPDQTKRRIAHAVGIGAVKYADLSMDRISDYKFSWDKMLALQGNTAPYMQYAYARVRSIFRKGAEDAGQLLGEPISLADPAERELAKLIARLEETLATVAAECRPNFLTAYLFALATAFSNFYETCPVLNAPPPLRASRLRLCDLTACVIKKGLELLGIEVVEKM